MAKESKKTIPTKSKKTIPNPDPKVSRTITLLKSQWDLVFKCAKSEDRNPSNLIAQAVRAYCEIAKNG